MRIKDIATSTAAANGDDHIVIDGAAAGVRRMKVSDLPGAGGEGSGNYFGKVAVSGQSDVVAETDPDTLNLAAGTGIAITTNATTDTVTIAVGDAELAAVAGLTSAADKGLYFTGSGTAATFDLTAYVRALCSLSSAADVRSNMGLGTIATQAASAVAITGGTIAGITDLAVADGGTGASDAAGARTNLGLAIGTNVQAWDADLDGLAGVNTTGFLRRTGAGTFVATEAGSGGIGGNDAKSGNYTLVAGDSGKFIVCSAGLTISLPALGTLGTGFNAHIVNDSGGTVTIDGPGGTNVAVAGGEVASIMEVHNGTAAKQIVAKGGYTVVS